jgi:rSAM/selenodomain-associated transferase 2
MISIIIPTLNEEKTIGACLKQIEPQSGPHEVIVVDGGSRDNTAAVVGRFPHVRWLRASAKGRGSQMNRGAKAARGDILLFLHADTRLPSDGLSMIAARMQPADVVAGSFSLRFDHPNAWLRLFARLSRINHVLFTYGDQGFFMARHAFQRLGGYAEIPLMEDVEIQRRLRRIGRVVKLDQEVVTSARRFLATGILHQQLLNTALVLLFYAGVPPARLKRYYR